MRCPTSKPALGGVAAEAISNGWKRRNYHVSGFRPLICLAARMSSWSVRSGDVAVLAVATHYLHAGEDSSVREQLASVILALFKAPNAAPGFLATLKAVSALPTLVDDIIAM